MSWLNDWEEAAEHPRRTLGFMLVAGLVAGGAIGYLEFGRSIVWAAVLGVGLAAVLTYSASKQLRDPAARKRRPREHAIPALARLAMHFLVLLVAFLVALATGSLMAFTVVFAVGLIFVLALRLSIWR